MLITTAQKNEITKLAVTMFGAAPGAYQSYLENLYISNGADIVATATALGNEPAFAAMYSGTNAQITAKIISNLSLGEISDLALKTLAEGYISDQVDAGADLGELFGFALSYMEANSADFSEALAIVNKKVEIGNAFTAGNGKNVTDLDTLMAEITGVTADTDVPAYAHLTVEQDAIFGNSSDNVFKAFLSADSDTFQSGDYINGGAGTDTLEVTLANSPYAIIAETMSVEKLTVQSQANGDDQGDNEVEGLGYGTQFGNAEFSTPADGGDNTIDAQLMNGTTEFWNTESRADLVIEDIRNNSHQTTIGWQAADPGDVDYAVFFQPTSITAPGAEAEGAQLFLELLDLESMALGNGPLDENPYVGVVVTVDGVTVEIVGDSPITTTYADVVAGFNSSLTLQGYTNITASLGAEFSKFNSDDGQQYTGTTIVLTNSGAEALAGSGWTTGGELLPPGTNIHTAITDVVPSVSGYLTQTDIILDWVGRGSKAGDFIAGNMSTGTNSDSAGIQQFNVDVDRNSWIDSMQSTNNTLEVVNVENIGAKGSLRIDKLNDVRVFDAAAMVGDVTLTAELSSDITAKYLDLVDTASDASADNSEVTYNGVVDREFSYDLGTGNDTLNLAVESANLAAAGTATREDFVLEVTGGAGNDNITFSIVDDVEAAHVLAGSTENWYTNQAILGNITITSGTGDDTVTTTGAGNVTITTGSGNDTVYTDNAGLTLTTAAFDTVSETFLFVADFLDNADEVVDVGGTSTAIGDATVLADVVTAAITSYTAEGFTVVDNGAGSITVSLQGAVAFGGTIPTATFGASTLVELAVSTTVAEATVTTPAGVIPPATWVVNAANTDIDNLQSNAETEVFLVDGQVTVTLSTAASAAALGLDNGFESVAISIPNGTDYMITDLDVNQAVKQAINSDAVLSKLLVATDGPGRTLVIESLIDGTFAADDLAIVVNSTYNHGTAAQSTVDAVNAAFGISVNNSGTDYVPDATQSVNTALLNGITGLSGGAGEVLATKYAAAMTGTDSTYASDNVITGGAGDDLIVLGTDATGTTATASNDTVVFSGSFGTDTIVNFNETAAGQDKLDFTAYQTSQTSASGSTDSAVTVATAVVLADDIVANSIVVTTFAVVDGIDGAVNTFATLTDAQMLTALNADATFAADVTADIVGTTVKAVILVENAANNDGEYKVYDVTYTEAAGLDDSDNFTQATLVGTIDLGDAATFTAADFA